MIGFAAGCRMSTLAFCVASLLAGAMLGAAWQRAELRRWKDNAQSWKELAEKRGWR